VSPSDHSSQEARAFDAGLSLPTIDSVRAGCYSDEQLDALIHDVQRRANEIPETTSVEAAVAIANQLESEPVRLMRYFVADDHVWPDGWNEARSYLPMMCPCCCRPRLLYAVRPEKPGEGILAHCEKCHVASYDETELGVARL
jgi:hypothetical protein